LSDEVARVHLLGGKDWITIVWGRRSYRRVEAFI